MATPRTSKAGCGCTTVWSDEEGQYVLEQHTCSPEVWQAYRQRERALALRMHEESKRRSEAPLYHKPFSLLR